METLNPSQWLNMGLGGAALFLVFVLMILFMKLQAKSSSSDIQTLASKIDKLADSNLEMVKTLATTLTQWNIEQRTNSNVLGEISRTNNEQNSKLDRIEVKLDSLFNLKCRAIDDTI